MMVGWLSAFAISFSKRGDFCDGRRVEFSFYERNCSKTNKAISKHCFSWNWSKTVAFESLKILHLDDDTIRSDLNNYSTQSIISLWINEFRACRRKPPRLTHIWRVHSRSSKRNSFQKQDHYRFKCTPELFTDCSAFSI